MQWCRRWGEVRYFDTVRCARHLCFYMSGQEYFVLRVLANLNIKVLLEASEVRASCYLWPLAMTFLGTFINPSVFSTADYLIRLTVTEYQVRNPKKGWTRAKGFWSLHWLRYCTAHSHHSDWVSFTPKREPFQPRRNVSRPAGPIFDSCIS